MQVLKKKKRFKKKNLGFCLVITFSLTGGYGDYGYGSYGGYGDYGYGDYNYGYGYGSGNYGKCQAYGC